MRFLVSIWLYVLLGTGVTVAEQLVSFDTNRLVSLAKVAALTAHTNLQASGLELGNVEYRQSDGDEELSIAFHLPIPKVGLRTDLGVPAEYMMLVRLEKNGKRAYVTTPMIWFDGGETTYFCRLEEASTGGQPLATAEDLKEALSGVPVSLPRSEMSSTQIFSVATDRITLICRNAIEKARPKIWLHGLKFGGISYPIKGVQKPILRVWFHLPPPPGTEPDMVRGMILTGYTISLTLTAGGEVTSMSRPMEGFRGLSEKEKE